jgi:hypothetical protein
VHSELLKEVLHLSEEKLPSDTAEFLGKVEIAKEKFKTGKYVIVDMKEYCKEIENLCGAVTYRNERFFVVSSIRCTNVRYSFNYVDVVLHPGRFKAVTRREAVIASGKQLTYGRCSTG